MGPGGAVLEIDRIAKRFGPVVALHEVSVTARAGELFGLAGADGAGKTTALRIATGVLPADAGRVRWRSAPIDPATRRRIGYLPAPGGLSPGAVVLDELVHRGALHGLDPNDARHRANCWLERVGLRTRRTLRVGALDPTQRRLVALAATLLPDPELLVLDEPFAGVTGTGVPVLAGVLRDQADAGVPVVLSSNDFDLVERHCDRAAVLRAGRLVATGSIAELRAAAPRMLAVDVPEATPGWARDIRGCRIVDVDGSRVLLELGPGIDDQIVLTAALATGLVREFAPVRRSLAELFGPRP